MKQKTKIVESSDEEISEEDVYEVERIIRHRETKRGTEYLIRWKGYSSDDDTWEPKEYINDEDLITEYWKKPISSGTNPSSPKYKTKKVMVTDAYPTPDITDWEAELDKVDTITKNDLGEYIVVLLWKNRLRSLHPIEIANMRCPQKMIEFYEKHIRFSGDTTKKVKK